MKYLPVPPLRQSLDRYLGAVRPLLGVEQMQRAEKAVEDFATGDGPACQAQLLRFADQENAAGGSWMSREWLSVYLSIRDPLPLASNVGFRIRPGSASAGVAHAADTIHRIASVHLSHLRGDVEDEVSPRGHRMDMRQWQVLAGGMRHPRPREDVFLDGHSGAATREIGVLWKGRCLMMPISDVSGHPLSRGAVRDALHRLRTLPPAANDTFTHLSYLGSDKAAVHLDALLEDPYNVETYDRLVHAVFLVNVTDTPATDEHHQERITFEPGQAWAYKPFTYQVSLVEDFVGVHVEHSVVDGVTLRSMVMAMAAAHSSDQPTYDGPALALEPLSWTMQEDRAAELSRDIAAYRRRSAAHRVRIVGVPNPVPDGLPFSASNDAIQQFILLYAQLSTYAQARSTYEAVDMREHQAGRTECLRPVTTDALVLARALLEGRATPDLLRAALASHREQVIACKSGQGFDRHLMGLRDMAGRLGLEPALFEDGSFEALTTDFLSTSSVGDDRQIIRFTFAPTSVGGIGVNYTVTDTSYEFCLTHDSRVSQRIEEFITALEEGASAVRGLLDTL